MATGFYKELFRESNTCAPFCLTGSFPFIDASWLQDMGSIPSDYEIHEILKSIGGFKAPRVDGIQTVFYQTQWQVVGPSVC